ncbi:metalloregulator ArsR/SmtB family transcription factor [Streptomyces subrutilus]|uniref:ArsR/SmtB family transcription factor n=1 Tax=Streptomyces subrutilus TaxID=36818 RepID=UPI002E12E777|nr:metalloregulator ArsR/SmtB family transcription factor [Streptomyces subrutilus]
MQVPLYQAKAEFFRMLGHPVRIRVLELLQRGPMPVRDLLAEIDIEASNLSQQLGVLRRAGIVVSLRDGSTVSYALAGGDVADLLRAARRILTELLAGQSELLAELRQAGPESDRRADTDTDTDTRAGSGGRAVERAEACGER